MVNFGLRDYGALPRQRKSEKLAINQVGQCNRLVSALNAQRLASFIGQAPGVGRRLLRLLDAPVQHDQFAVDHTEQDTGCCTSISKPSMPWLSN